MTAPRTVTDAEVARHFPLVRFVIGKMLRSRQLWRELDLDDVEAVGRCAAWEALRRWDPTKGAQSTYLTSYIWGYLMRYQRDVSKAHGWHRDRGQIASVASLDAPADKHGDGATLLDVIAERAPSSGDEREQLVELLHVAARLEGDERVIAEHLLTDQPVTAAAHRLGVTHQQTYRLARRVRRAFAEAIA